MSRTDTNQASEDELTKIIDRVYLFGMNGGLGYEKFYNELSPNDAKTAIKAIIRTEKLKLLAEVRGRVVGEHKPKTRGLTQNPNNAAYWTKASQAEFDLIEEQLAELTELEAEL